MVEPWLQASDGGTRIAVHIQPGASHSEVMGIHGDALKVRIAARAVEGAANAALQEFLARCLGMPRREVRILKGEKSRRKLIWVALGPEEARRRLLGNMA